MSLVIHDPEMCALVIVTNRNDRVHPLSLRRHLS